MNTDPIRILLVEDSPTDADLLRQTLSPASVDRFELTWVERLEEALARLRQQSFDVLLLDLSLPDSSGPETFRRARNAAPELPIVVLTGSGDDRIGLAAVQEGVQDFLVKGETDGRQIARAVRYAIERKQAAEQLLEQREWLRVTLTSIGDAVVATDTAGCITFLNPVAEFLTGWTAQEALGQPIQSVFRIIDERSRQASEDLVARVLAEKRGITLANHTVLIAKDGRELAIEDSVAPIMCVAGRVTGAVLVFHEVTEKQRAQEALRRAKEEWERTFDSVPDLIAILDNEHRIVRANRAMAERLGVTPAECVGLKCFECVHKTEQPPEFCPHAQTVRDGLEHAAEVHEDHLGGDFLVTTTPLRDEHGRMVGSAHVARDITARKRSEEALRQSREDLQRAQAVAHAGSWRLDVRRNELVWSDETHRMFGIPKGTSLTYETFLASVHPQDREFVDRSWRAALAGEPYDIEHRIAVGGDVKWVRERAEIEFDLQGTLIGGFGTVQDITGRKRAEERIRHQNAVLEGINRVLREALTTESEEELGRTCLAVAEEVTQSKFGFVGEIGPSGRIDAIAISDPGWEACKVETAGQRKLPKGFEIHGLPGRVILDGKGFFTNDPSSHPDSIGTPAGHPPLTAFLGVPLKHDGKTMGMIGVGNREGGYSSQDLEGMEALAQAVVQVFMRKRAERAVRAGEERLRQAQKMESIGLLAGGVAHDFNNLLTSIMGNASLLEEEVLEESRDKLRSLLLATEKAADLTRQLLAYAGKGRFVVESLNLSRIVRDMTDLLRASIPRKVTIKLALKPDLPGILADRGQMQQIVMNLVINAAEAIGADQSGTVTIATRAQAVSETDRILDEVTAHPLAPGSYVCFEVADTGCGMDNETRKKIFDPFFTTKFIGRGLGLAALAGIVQQHSGAIDLETAPGQGATFRVFLPAVAAAEAPRHDAPQPQLRGKGTVLVVDDEASVREVALGTLERYGYRVLEASDGSEAVRVFEEHAGEIGLVLLDLTMPVVGGDEVIGALKARRADVSVIVMSGYGEEEVAQKFAGQDVSGFLQKPFTAARLAEVVKKALTDRAGKGLA
jgi:PAS domain S-box-containing protein